MSTQVMISSRVGLSFKVARTAMPIIDKHENVNNFCLCFFTQGCSQHCHDSSMSQFQNDANVEGDKDNRSINDSVIDSL